MRATRVRADLGRTRLESPLLFGCDAFRGHMTLDLGTLWAALVCMASTMVVGALWYGPVFGKPWMRAVGMDKLSEDDLQKVQKEAMPGYMVSMGSAGIAAVLLDLMLDWAIPGSPYVDQPGWLGGMAIAFTMFITFYVPGTLTAQFFEGRRWLMWALGAGYWGVLALIWGAAVGGLS